MLQYGKFKSTNGENNIITYTWEPKIKPIGVVQIVHGMIEYMSRYSDFAEYLNANGFIVCGHDHLGHGRTALEYGMFGYFGNEKGAKTLVDDSSKFTHMIKEKYRDLPLFLFGHSMGSFITRIQILKDSRLLSGYICSGSSDSNPLAPYVRVFAGLKSNVSGGRKVAIPIAKIMQAKVFDRALKPGEPLNAWISHDRQIVDDYTADLHMHFYFTNRAYCDLMDLIMASTSDYWYKNVDPNLPILLLSGNEDPVGNMGKDIKKIFKRLNQNSKPIDLEYMLYDNMRHEVLNEIHRHIVYKDILDWLDAHVDNNKEAYFE